MKFQYKKIAKGLLGVAAAALLLSCEGELNRGDSPVQLVATTQQTINNIDLTAACGNLGTVLLEVRVKSNFTTDTRFLDVQLKNYQVTYVRTDGGTVAPASFVRTVSGILTAGGGATSSNVFFVFTPDAFDRAPFVALLPQNGGVDPETGRRFIQLDVITQIFGETLSGQAVSATTREGYVICANCGGCF